jgi:hypothetical protein
VKDEDEALRIMGGKMMEKFEKYWEDYSVVLAFGAILDPRVKLETLGFCYEKIYPSSWETKLCDIKKKLYTLFSHYSCAIYASTSGVPNLFSSGETSSSALIKDSRTFSSSLFDVSQFIMI